MPSSTSSSENNAGMSKYDRALPGDAIRPAALIGLIVMIVMMSGWELYWRGDGSIPSYRNSEGLWAIERRRVDDIEGEKTVLAGSSRMFFNTQLDVWERVSGERPIQLSLEGTSPITLMESLAEDPDTQWLGQQISMLIEPYLAFYHRDYSLFAVIKRQPFPRREGVFFEMDVRRLATYTKDRNARMYAKVETDDEYAEIAKEIWAQFHRPIEDLSEEELAAGMENHNAQIDRAVAATKKLQEKGVEVIFVRHPFEGIYDVIEPMYFPRAGGWDVLIERTGALGVHFRDHEELQGFSLPESSHLAAADSDRFTEALYRLIERELARRDSGEQQ